MHTAYIAHPLNVGLVSNVCRDVFFHPHFDCFVHYADGFDFMPVMFTEAEKCSEVRQIVS